MSSKKPSTVSKSKQPAKAPLASSTPKVAGKKSATWASTNAHLFSKNARTFGIGQAVPPTKDLTRFTRWPKYIRLQRQKAILQRRLKVPPALNQFSQTLDKNSASNLFRLLSHYRPESQEQKTLRLKEAAAAAAAAAKTGSAKEEPKQSAATKPVFVKYGLNHVTQLIESKKAKLVVIAHDVDPIELVVWLPALCRKMNVPYVIVKGKARLGHIVYKKTASVLAVTDVKKDDVSKLEQFANNARIQFNDNASSKKTWGGGILGPKATIFLKKRAARLARSVKV